MRRKSSNGITPALRRFGLNISAPLGALASISTVLIMIVVTIDVFSRNLGGSSIPGILEMSETALVATVFLGLAYTGATNGHVSVDLVTANLSEKASRVLAAVVWAMSSAIVIWFIYASVLRAVNSTEMGEVTRGMIEWPIWPARWLLVIGYTAFLLIALINTYLSVCGEPLLGEDQDSQDDINKDESATSDLPNSASEQTSVKEQVS